MKLKTKITLVLILISIVATLTIAVFTAVNTKSLFDSYIDNYRESRQEQWGRVLQEYYAERGSWVGVNSILPQVREHEVQGMMRGRKVTSSEQIFLVDSNGVYIAPIGKNAINYPNSTQLTKATPIKVDGELIGSVYLKVPDDDLQGFATLENHFISSVFYFSLGAGLLVAFFAVFIGIAFSNKIVRPLNQLKETTKRFSDGEWDVKIDLDGSDEISELAQAFNMMGQKLQEAELARKTLVADVAHELRNPLATLRAQLESIQEGVAQPNPQIVLSLNDEVIKLGRLVNDLQDLSLAEVGRLRLKKERADVGKVIKKITNVFETSLEDKEIELVLNFEKKIEMEIDPHRINQVIVNLLAKVRSAI